MLCIDMTAIPPEIGVFDVILCSHVLEHIPDDRRALRELFRVLKPGGWAVFLVPVEPGRADTFEDPRVVTPEERERLFRRHDHVRVYGHDFKQRIEEAGFTANVHRYAKELGRAAVEMYGLKRKDEIYFCVKPPGNVDRSASGTPL